MTVKQLMDLLKDYPPDWQVCMPDDMPIIATYIDDEACTIYVSDDDGGINE